MRCSSAACGGEITDDQPTYGAGSGMLYHLSCWRGEGPPTPESPAERRGWDMDDLLNSQWGRFDPVAKKCVELGMVPMWTLGELCDLAGSVTREIVSEHTAGLIKRLAEET